MVLENFGVHLKFLETDFMIGLTLTLRLQKTQTYNLMMTFSDG